MEQTRLIEKIKGHLDQLSEEIIADFDPKVNAGVGLSEIMSKVYICFEIVVVEYLNDDDYGLALSVDIISNSEGRHTTDIILHRSSGPILASKELIVEDEENAEELISYLQSFYELAKKTLANEYIK